MQSQLIRLHVSKQLFLHNNKHLTLDQNNENKLLSNLKKGRIQNKNSKTENVMSSHSSAKRLFLEVQNVQALIRRFLSHLGVF